MIIYSQWTFQKYPWFFDMSKKVWENLKNIFLANLCKIVDIQVPLWSHFLNLIICSYFVTKCFSEAYILILHPKCSSGDPWNISLAVLWPEKNTSKDILFSWKLGLLGTQSIGHVVHLGTQSIGSLGTG